MTAIVYTIYRRFLPLTLPILLIGGGYIYMPHLNEVRQALPKVFIYLPLITYAATIALSLHFNLTRIAYILIAFSIAYIGYGNSMAGGGGLKGEVIGLAIATFLPLNVALFAFLKERGLLTLHGLIRTAFIAGQVGITLWIIGAGRSDLYRPFMRLAIIEHPLMEALLLPQPLIIINLAAFVLVLLACHIYRSPLENGLAGASLALMAALLSMGSENGFILFMSVAGIILLVGVVRNAHYMAYRDELTGLMGRRALNERLLMLGRRYTVAMLDVDHFKKFNDTYGHDAGDQVLKMVAAKMQKVGGGGRVYRYGGEEFTILFPGRSADAAEPCLETLRKRIADYSMGLRGKDRADDKGKGKTGGSARRVSVRVSIGVAERDGRMTPGEVVKAADEALYRAKEQGRNRVCR
ncbi:MAG: GGDEF domain-containing protein [bacterium]|nr:GGDEF domain-containing protein [bacterium]